MYAHRAFPKSSTSLLTACTQRPRNFRDGDLVCITDIDAKGMKRKQTLYIQEAQLVDGKWKYQLRDKEGNQWLKRDKSEWFDEGKIKFN